MELSIDVPVVDEQIDGLHDVVAGVRSREEEGDASRGDVRVDYVRSVGALALSLQKPMLGRHLQP